MSRFVLLALVLFFSCQNTKKFRQEDKPVLTSDTIKIANEELEYEVIIIDPGFQSWFNGYARPRNYYSQSYLESRNRFWVLEYNNRVRQPMQFSPSFYEWNIDYQNNIDYGYEVNYMLYNYLVYFQLTYKQQLGGFQVRI